MFKKNKEKAGKHPFWALTVMVIIVAIMTWIVPAGQYERVVNDLGRTVVDPQSFTYIESNPAGIGDFFSSFFKGFVKAADVMAAVTIVGGAFGVLKGVGILDASINSLTKKLGKHNFGIFAMASMTCIGLIYSFTGMCELDLIFLPLMIPLCLKMGYDTMTAFALVTFGSLAGFAGAMANPFFTGIIHEIAELPLYSALWYRGLVSAFFLIAGLLYLMHYAKKVKADPMKSASLSADKINRIKFLDAESNETQENQLTTREKLAGLSFLAIFAYMVFGCVQLGFGFAELGGCFMAMALVTGLVAGRSLNQTLGLFAEGISDMVIGIFIIFFARSLLVLMEDAMIIDTIIHTLSQLIVGSSSVVSAVMMFLVSGLINFFIPSGSGQAVVTGPIMIPLADLAGVTRQTASLAAQLGDGLGNYCYPTIGQLMAMLAIAGLSFREWMKFFWKLFIVLVGGGALFVAVAQMINLA